MKYSKTALGLLNAQYRSVLRKCMLINLGLFALGALAATPANAADTWTGAITETDAFMDNLATTSGGAWDRNNGPVTGWGVDQILTVMQDAATKTDTAVALVNDTNKGNEKLDERVSTLESAGYQNATQVGSAISDAIDALDLANTYQAKGDYQAALDTDQLAAVNSGITAAGVEQITTNKNDIATINSSAVMTSGITAAGVEQITTNKNDIATINSSAVMTSGITAAGVEQITTNKNDIATINSSAVMTSGITAAGVEQITTNKNDIATLDNDLGDVTAFTGSTTGNISNSVPGEGTNADNASSAIANIDATIGQIHGLAATIDADEGKNNLEQGSTVSGHLTALAGAIGNRDAVGTGGYITAGATVSQSLAALDTALDHTDDAIIDIYSQMNGATYDPATGTVTGGEALTVYDGANTITGVVNKLETNKQEKLVIAADSGLKWTDADETALALKLADTTTSKSGLQLDDNGLSIKAGDTITVSKEGYVNIHYDTDTFQANATDGLQVKNKGIKAGMIDDNAVDTAQIADGAVTEDKLATDSVSTAKIQDTAVTSAKIADNAVTTAKIDDGAVTNDKLALLSVDTGNIIDSAVTTAKLADNAVSTDKIQDEAVTFAKIDSDAVDTTGASITAGTDNVLTTGAAVKAAAENANYTGTSVTGATTDTSTLKGAIDATTVALNNVLTATGDEIDSAKVDVQWNGEDKTLAYVLGNGNYDTAYNVADGDTVTAAISKFDAAIGNREDLGSRNDAINTATATDVASGLKAAGDAIGNLQYAAPDDVAYGALTAGTDLTTVAAQIAKNIGDAANAANGNIVATNTVNANLDALDVEIGADADYASTNNGVSGDKTVKANINAINAKLGNVADVAVNGYDATADDATLVAAVNKLDTNMEGVLGGIYNQETGAYDATVLAGHGFEADTENLSDALNKYAENVNNAMGTTFAADGSFTNEYTRPAAVDYDGLATDATLVEAIAQLDANIGNPIAGVNRSNTLADATTAADATVNANIAALDTAIGDLDYANGGVNYALASGSVTEGIKTLNANIGEAVANAKGNLEGAEATVNDNLDALDVAIGKRTDLGSRNGDINDHTANSVAEGLKAAGDAIGDMNFGGSHYIAGDEDLSSAVRSLDSNLYRVDQEVHDVRRELNRGMASMAAMSALVPNPRAKGNTSLAIGTGAYSGHTAMAIGGFHHLTDNLMLNAGAAWGNSSDVSCRLGLTWSW